MCVYCPVLPTIVGVSKSQRQKWVENKVNCPAACSTARLESTILKHCIVILFHNCSSLLLLFHASVAITLRLCSFYTLRIHLETTMYNAVYMQIVTLASISGGRLFILIVVAGGQNATVLMLVAHFFELNQLSPRAGCSLLWVESVDSAILSCCHVVVCACALLLFRHNAQTLLVCNCSHIMLCILDSSLPTTFPIRKGNLSLFTF